MKKIGNFELKLFLEQVLLSFSGSLKLLLLLFIVSPLFSVEKNVRLYVHDMDHNPIRQIEKGIPFLLQVVVDNINGAEEPNHIPGFEKFQVTRYGSSQSTNIINGQRTDRTIFNFALRAESFGTFQLGPLSIQDKQGNVVVSDVAHVVVGDTTVAHSIKKSPFFLETRVDKKSLYVGEELLVKIRFYYVNEFENLRIVDPKFEGFVIGEISQEPVVGKEMVRGLEYRYQEWLIKVHPKKAGALIVPSVQAVFRVAADFSQNIMGIFDMFGMSSEKTVQSPARSIDVVPLPQSEFFKNVTAVGDFDRAVFSLNQSKGEVGEGMVATCVVSGSGNFEMIKAPELQLPAGLKYYEANSSLRKIENNKQEKTFEYIVQAEHSGDFVIPAQEFKYFDVVEKKYKKLLTNEALLKVVEDVPAFQENEETAGGGRPVSSPLKDTAPSYTFKEGEINYVVETGLVFNPGSVIIEGLLFWLIKLLIFLSSLILLFLLYKNYIEAFWYKTSWSYYISMRWMLYKAIRNQNVLELYGLFEQVCKHFNIELQGQSIVDGFKKAKVPDVKLQEWKLFVKTLLEVVFFEKHSFVKDKLLILEQGRYWMLELLKVCYNMPQKKDK